MPLLLYMSLLLSVRPPPLYQRSLYWCHNDDVCDQDASHVAVVVVVVLVVVSQQICNVEAIDSICIRSSHLGPDLSNDIPIAIPIPNDIAFNDILWIDFFSGVSRFIARLPDGPKKAEEYAAVGLFREAAEAAARARDSDMLTKIQGMVGTSSPLGVAVTQIKDRLQSSLR